MKHLSVIGDLEEVYEKIKENASIDWTIKESVKAKLKVIVKRILRKYGYPPDMQMLATETVLKQAEMIGKEGNNYLVRVNHLKTGVPAADSLFVFDASKHPGVEIIDMR